MNVVTWLVVLLTRVVKFVTGLWELFKTSSIYQTRWTIPKLLLLGFTLFIIAQLYTYNKLEQLRRLEHVHYLPPIMPSIALGCGSKNEQERLHKTTDALWAPSARGRTLIVYNYYECTGAEQNLKFFLKHGLHERQDVHFLFVLSSPTCVSIPEADNVAMVHAQDQCYAFSAISNAITRLELGDKYEKYILMGSWVKGPFMPNWSTACWTDAFTRLLDDYHQVVGTTYGCFGSGEGHRKVIPHLHPTAWAVQRESLVDVLLPFRCPTLHDLGSALDQTSSYLAMRSKLRGVAVLASALHLEPLDHCPRDEWQYIAHPFETVFVNPRVARTLKHSQFINPKAPRELRQYDYLGVATTAMESRNYDSRHYCT